jgi:hypothetical protein
MRFSKLTLLSVLLLTFSCTQSVERPRGAENREDSGGWISSGGADQGDSSNPWFVYNTQRVSYCIVHDAAGVSARVDSVRRQITAAINTWKSEFGHYYDRKDRDTSEVLPARVATQTFEEVDCAQNPPLRFHFGWDSLNDTQKNFLRADKGRTIGIAVRTAYDRVTLAGRGFIYLSSDRGANRYTNTDMVDEAWSMDGLLFHVLLHELGHVFGIPHYGSWYATDAWLGAFTSMLMQPPQVMSTQFPEFILSKYRYKRYAEPVLGQNILESRNFRACSWIDETEIIFEAVKTCTLINEIEGKDLAWSLAAEETPHTPYGTLRVTYLDTTPIVAPGIPEVIALFSVKLTSEQKVFSNDMIANGQMTDVPTGMILGYTGAGEYESVDHKKKIPVVLRVGPGELDAIIVGKNGPFLALTTRLPRFD